MGKRKRRRKIKNMNKNGKVETRKAYVWCLIRFLIFCDCNRVCNILEVDVGVGSRLCLSSVEITFWPKMELLIPCCHVSKVELRWLSWPENSLLDQKCCVGIPHFTKVWFWHFMMVFLLWKTYISTVMFWFGFAKVKTLTGFLLVSKSRY